ncbi:MAG: hypothetical protein ACKPKO_22085, partial [Candidatus Fonsibacter sp.]
MYLGIDLGYLSHKPSSSSLNLAPFSKSATAAHGSTKQSGKQAVKLARDKSNNALHAATLVLSDPDYVRKGHMLLSLAHGCRLWHS